MKTAEQGNLEAQFNLGLMYSNGDGVRKDEAEAFKWYMRAAEKGDIKSQHNLGYMYNNGKGVEEDKKEAFKWYMKAAEQGNNQAQYNLGCMYYNGNGVEVNYSKAFEWYKKAAEQGDEDAKSILKNEDFALQLIKEDAENGDINAQIKLGDYFALEYKKKYDQYCDNNYDGGIVLKEANEAIKWYSKAAEQGNAEAQYKLGNMYNGDDDVRDIKEANKWYNKAAEQGNVEAQVKLGDISLLYFYSNEDERDKEEAIKWYSKAAEQNNAEGQYKLGNMYNGDDDNRDLEKAIKWYSKSAKQGNVDAFLALGEIYSDNETYNIEEAIKWYYKAAEQGNVEAFLALANIYSDDKTCNIEEAIKWCCKAAEQGDEDDIDECGNLLNRLGNKYLYGSGVVRDYRKSADCFRKAAELGNIYAQYNLALAYYNGKGVEQNHSMAAVFFTAAAKQGNVDAQGIMGQLYEKGDGVTKNFKEAFKWYYKAAEQLDAESQNKIGGMYEKGIGVPKDLEKAIAWYYKAVKQGYEEANKNLARVETELNNLNKSKNNPHVQLSELGIKIMSLALNNAFNDNLWKSCGFEKTPIRGSILNAFVNSERLAKETFLTREFIIAPLGIFVRKLCKLVSFPVNGYVRFLTNYILENNEGVSESLKFNDINIAKRYFNTYINEYVNEENSLIDVFLRHCSSNSITPDSNMVSGAQVVCDSLSKFLEQKIKEVDNNYFVETDITEYGTYKTELYYY